MKTKHKRRFTSTREVALVIVLLAAIGVSGFAYQNATGFAILKITDTNSGGSGADYISGSGTANYISKFTSPNSIGNSVIYENNGKIGIGTTNPDFNAKLQIQNDNALETKMIIKSTKGYAWLGINSNATANPYINFQAGNKFFWSIGDDALDGEKFKISQASGVGFNDKLTITTGGDVTIQSLSGNQTTGIAYVCADRYGQLFRSYLPCDQALDLRIEMATNSTLFVRNAGTAPLHTSELEVYVNYIHATCVWNTAVIQPGFVATCTSLNPRCSMGAPVTVTAPGLSDTKTCS